jgi:hypothetical protein
MISEYQKGIVRLQLLNHGKEGVSIQETEKFLQVNVSVGLLGLQELYEAVEANHGLDFFQSCRKGSATKKEDITSQHAF